MFSVFGLFRLRLGEDIEATFVLLGKIRARFVLVAEILTIRGGLEEQCFRLRRLWPWQKGLAGTKDLVRLKLNVTVR